MLEEYAEMQPVAFQIMKNTIKKGTLSHAYLIETNGFSLKNEFVFAFAKYILCPYHHLEHQTECNVCRHQKLDNFLDIKWVKPDGMWIKKEQLSEVQKEFKKTSIDGNQKIYVIENANQLNQSAANSILKFLEEPEKNIIAILMVDNIYQLLPTIISRCQIIHLKQDKKVIDTLEQQFSKEFVDFVYHFLDYVETYKMESILYENKLWLMHFTDKEEIEKALNVLIYLYKDVINILIKKEIENFSHYKKELKKIADLNTVETICNKINIILEKREQLKININQNLLVDDLIIQLSEV